MEQSLWRVYSHLHLTGGQGGSTTLRSTTKLSCLQREHLRFPVHVTGLNMNILEVVPEVAQLKALPTEFQVVWAFMKIFQFQKSSYIIKMCWRPLTLTLKMAGISWRDRLVKASCRFETGLRRFDQVSDRWQNVRWVSNVSVYIQSQLFSETGEHFNRYLAASQRATSSLSKQTQCSCTRQFIYQCVIVPSFSFLSFALPSSSLFVYSLSKTFKTSCDIQITCLCVCVSEREGETEREVKINMEM